MRKGPVLRSLSARAVSAVMVAGLILAGCTSSPAPKADVTEEAPVLGEIDTSSSPVSQRQLARLKVPDAGDLLGKSETDVTELFGAPTLAREETNAKVWQYAHGACILFFYLYEDPMTARYAVTHVDARGPKQGAAPTQDCVAHAFKSHYVAKASL